MFRSVAGWVYLGVCVVLLVSIAAAWAQPMTKVYAEVPDLLRPGQPIPKGASCTSYLPRELSCRLDSYRFFVEYGTITYTREYLSDDTVALGALILNWGTPLCVNRYGDTVAVYWRDRYVYATALAFTPDNPVSVVIWDQHVVRSCQRWQGFTNPTD